LHVNVHTAAAQAIVAFATSGHFVLQAPQWFTLVNGSTHSAPQATGACGVQPFVHWNVAAEGVHFEASGPHAALHAPQLVAFDRSASHPSALFALQSA
jgi:hypothetical protein